MKKKEIFICFLGLLFIVFQSYAQKGNSPLKVASIGNSVTYGYGLEHPESEAYPTQLQILLGNKYFVKNFGHSGATLLRAGHNPYYKTQEYQEALDFKPDIAIIHLGLNDTDPRNWPNYSQFFERDYAQLIADIREVNPEVKIYITLMTPIFSEHPRFLSGTRDWYDKIQQLIPQIAKNNDVQLIDINTPLKARSDLFADNLHPDKEGARIIAKQVALAVGKIYQPLLFDRTFTSNMVLQRDRKNTISGQATPEEKVSLTFGRKTQDTKSDLSGNWKFELPKMKAGGPYRITVSTKNEKQTIDNVLFGDVYLASGQSNMAFTLAQASDTEGFIKSASDLKNVRLYKAKNFVETDAVSWDKTVLDKINKLQFFSGKWEESNSSNAASFSAVAYTFAKEIAEHEHIPIGIIDISVGGSTTESWISRKDLEDDNLLATYIGNWKTSDFMMDWVRERAAKNLEYSKNPRQRHPYGPAYNFEAGITNWKNHQIKGVLWYQGESNAHNIALHAHLFETLIRSWRKNFKQDLPFYFVQLPGINRPSWGSFRNSQRLLEKEIPNVYMAVTLDLGDPTNVHPVNKIPVGKRLAYLAKRNEYGQEINANHPEVIDWEVSGKKITLRFNHTDYLETTAGNTIVKGFQIKDKYGFFHDVVGKIISPDQIEIPLQDFSVEELFYGFKPFSQANLINELEIPVSTFNLMLKRDNN